MASYTEVLKRRTAKTYVHDRAVETLRLLRTPGLYDFSRDRMNTEIMFIYEMAGELEWTATFRLIEQYLDEYQNQGKPGINNGGMTNVAEKR